MGGGKHMRPVVQVNAAPVTISGVTITGGTVSSTASGSGYGGGVLTEPGAVLNLDSSSVEERYSKFDQPTGRFGPSDRAPPDPRVSSLPLRRICGASLIPDYPDPIDNSDSMWKIPNRRPSTKRLVEGVDPRSSPRK